MTFFKKFKQFTYAGQPAVNILTAALPSRLNVDASYVYQTHRISDGETPESLADTLYSNANLYWVLFVSNSIVNPFTDWPMEDRVLEEYVTMKHGNTNGVHHFFDNRIGRVADDVDDAAYRAQPVGDLPYYIIPVANLVHERAVNDSKRDIVVINPRYVNQFVEAYSNAIEGKE